MALLRYMTSCKMNTSKSVVEKTQKNAFYAFYIRSLEFTINCSLNKCNFLFLTLVIYVPFLWFVSFQMLFCTKLNKKTSVVSARSSSSSLNFIWFQVSNFIFIEMESSLSGLWMSRTFINVKLTFFLHLQMWYAVYTNKMAI